jgi:hypothetical protein
MTSPGQSDLAEAALRTVELSKESGAWVANPANAARVGDSTGLGYSLRRSALRAARLARAASRKMCVGVFGPSQAGKSYLVSVLSSPDGGRLTTDLDGKVYDFLQDLNPPGGRESTALVTRMTTDRSDAPKGYPVALRVLSQTDLVKILANSFYLDFSLEHFDGARMPGPDAVRRRLEQLRSNARPQPVEHLDSDDVFDLREYLQSHFPKRSAVFSDEDWKQIIELAPRLTGRDRAQLWALLWYDFAPFTNLYLELFDGLRLLGFAGRAFADISALHPRADSIIDVKVLDRLGADDAAKVRLVPEGSSAEVVLPRSLIAALTAELRISVKEKPSPVFDHTDVLDFPGARSRLDIRSLDDAGKNEKGERTGNPLRELLLRGKVAYLFEGYTAEGEISALLLCIPDSVQDTVGLSATVEEWIFSTLGRGREERKQEKCSLFLLLTKMDREFATKDGLNDQDKDWGIRIESSLLKNFRGEWPNDWNGDPFNNVYWLRNPRGSEVRIMAVDSDKREIGFDGDFQRRAGTLHDTFVSNRLVRRHFADPEEAWREALRPNDGGVSYIVRRLSAVCDPATKTEQVRNRLRSVRADMLRDLEPLHVSDDLEVRLAQRLQVGDRIMDRFYDPVAAVRLGLLLRSLQVDGGDLESHLYRVLVHGLDSQPNEATPPTAEPVPGIVGVARTQTGIARPGSRSSTVPPQTPASPPPTAVYSTWERRAAQQVMRHWERKMNRAVEDTELARETGLPRELLAEVTTELLLLSRRTGVEAATERAIADFAHLEQNEQRIAKAAMVGQRFVNRLVSEMGFGQLPDQQRPMVTVADQPRPVFWARPVAYGIDGWHEDRPPFFVEFFDDWTNAFYRVIEDNAKSLAGITIDIEQNARLGGMLADLRRIV